MLLFVYNLIIIKKQSINRAVFEFFCDYLISVVGETAL